MPRGVPNSGRRESRSVAALSEGFEEAEADEAEDVAYRGVGSADAQAPELIAGEPIDTGRPDAELSPQELEIKQLRDKLARETGRKDVEPEVQDLHSPGDAENIIIHILEDGVTMLGKVWYRGQELEFEPGSRAWKDTFDRTGKSWLDLRSDEFAQAQRWGRVLFRNGPWPGKSYTDGTFESLRAESGGRFVPPPSAEELAAAERARERRAAPHLPSR